MKSSSRKQGQLTPHQSIQPPIHQSSPVLVAVVGGSGAGKSWLADRLQAALGRQAARLSLDDFYLDRSHLPLGRRARLNFDHPRAIDWPAFERVLRDLRAGRTAPLPCYDFATHCRLPQGKRLQPKPIILVDGLWLLRRRSLRSLFALSVFLDCPTRVRLRRRLGRDLRSRGRTRASVREQFWGTVEPMHCKFVAPQARWADLVLRGDFGAREVQSIAAKLSSLLRATRRISREKAQKAQKALKTKGLCTMAPSLPLILPAAQRRG